jgi:hypothetical protein
MRKPETSMKMDETDFTIKQTDFRLKPSEIESPRQGKSNKLDKQEE